MIQRRPRRNFGARLAIGLGLLVLAAGCANRGFTSDSADAARTQMEQATAAAAAKPPVVVPAHISDALQGREVPLAEAPAEPRFDLVVNNAQAREVFLAMVTDTRYSMLMHPEVAGTLSVTLRGVTVREALEAIRDVYGYDFKIDGRRITVFPPTLQTRIFTVNYLQPQARGAQRDPRQFGGDGGAGQRHDADPVRQQYGRDRGADPAGLREQPAFDHLQDRVLGRAGSVAARHRRRGPGPQRRWSTRSRGWSRCAPCPKSCARWRRS